MKNESTPLATEKALELLFCPVPGWCHRSSLPSFLAPVLSFGTPFLSKSRPDTQEEDPEKEFSHSKKHLFEYSKGLSSRIHKKTQKYMKRQSLEFAWFFEKKEGKTNGDQTIASKVSRRNRARTTRLTSVQEGEI